MNWPVKLAASLVMTLCVMTGARAESTIHLDLPKSYRQADSTTERLATFESRLRTYLAARQQINYGSQQEQLEAIAGEARMVLDLAMDYKTLNKDVRNMTRSLEATLPARRHAVSGFAKWGAGAERIVHVSLQHDGNNMAEAALIRYLLVVMRTNRHNTRDLHKAGAVLQNQLNVLADNLSRYRKWLRGEISTLRAQTEAL